MTRRALALVDDVQLPDAPLPRTEWMLRAMARHVETSLDDPRFVQWAREATSSGRSSTSPRERARRALKLVQRLQYVPDPINREQVQSPLATLRLAAGDCNSLSALLAAMLAAVGIEPRLVAVSSSPADPEWRHVYVEAHVDGRWLPADPSPLGQGARAVYLGLGHAPGPAANHIRLDATDPEAQLSGLLDTLGDVFEGIRDIATLKPLRKALRWSWSHMGAEMRALVLQVGPMVANMYAPGFGGTAAKAALSILEGDRQSREARKALKKLQEERQLPEDWDVDDPDHLEALVHAADMPDDLKREWLRQHGYRVAPKRKAAPALALGAGVAALYLL